MLVKLTPNLSSSFRTEIKIKISRKRETERMRERDISKVEGEREMSKNFLLNF